MVNGYQTEIARYREEATGVRLWRLNLPPRRQEN
jgi:hypothetical protein